MKNISLKRFLFATVFISIAIISIAGYLYFTKQQPALAAGNIINAASCEQTDVQGAIDAAQVGDTVMVPTGDCIWGANKTFISISKVITLKGAGQGQTRITLSDSGGTYTSGTIRISAVATVRDMTINGSNTAPVSAFSVFSVNGWRITGIDYNGGLSGAYFVYVGNVYGVIDHNDITGGVGNAELIFIRGPVDSWQTPNSIGGANNVFIEDNIFNGSGYVVDCNSNSRCVLRYNTITGNMKIDGHGKASNFPARGVRHMEIYSNKWTNTSNYWAAIEVRGGGGRIFDNIIESPSTIWIILTDYALTGVWPNFNNICQCPVNYPVDDQIGVGIDPKSGAGEPLYLWNNTKNGLPWSLTWKSTATCSATCGTFNVSDVIQSGRDYFMSDAKPSAMVDYIPYTYPHPLTIDATPPPPPLKGDFNTDGFVNDLDFTDFKNAFKSIFNSLFDLNSDSTIDVKDLGVLMNGWLE